MVILKNITAYDQLCTFAQDSWDLVGNLVKYIIDNHLEDSFDNYITMEFPNGCDETEFSNFCIRHKDEILKNI